MKRTPKEILKSMSLDQKLAQMGIRGGGEFLRKDKHFDKEKAMELCPHGIFGLTHPLWLTPEETGAWAREAYEFFSSVSPVPPIITCESIHGILAFAGTTVFPQSIGMGATFDPELMERIGDAIGKEARAMGIRMSLSPDLDLGREPRWGRIEETYGESHYLVGEMGAAYVRGIAGKKKDYVATLKHFAAHGSPESGLNLSPMNISLQELEDKYLPPFKKALDAGARGIMPAYSSLNGTPCHTHPYLMNDVLRERWGFDGIVITDFGAVGMLRNMHHQVERFVEAGKLILKAEVDVEGPATLGYSTEFKALVEKGEIDERDVDKVVLHVIQTKMEIGLFDLPAPDSAEISRVVGCDAHKALAREAAEKSIVLMKNDGALPLKKGQKLAVIGPNAFSAELGDYMVPRSDLLTPAEALKARAEKDGGSVITARGCEFWGSDTSGFSEALAAAAKADAIVCCIGGRSMKPYGEGWGIKDGSDVTCGEAVDTHDLTPGGPQLDLCRALIATGKPVTIVMIDGRPETLFDVAENCGALVAAWYPGGEGSAALASLLFGDKNFSGKLPVTFPRHVGQLPLCHDRLPSAGGYYHCPGSPEAPGRDYVFCSPTPAFEFGHGLGYSPILYGEPIAERVQGGVRLSFILENQGAMDAEEAVLVFVRDEVASLVQPIKKLAAIKRVPLKAGESKSVELFVEDSSLTFTNYRMEKVLEPGWFTFTVGDKQTRLYIE